MAERKGLRYLYECDDCHERRMVSWVEANRAARPKCYGCGSTRLEIVSKAAREDQIRLNQERIMGTGGSLKLASGCDELERKRAVR